MKLPRDVSADQAVAALRRLGFIVVRQRGSHIRLTNATHSVTVPAHNPIAIGTLKSLIRQAGVSEEDFCNML
jgi:predicted RNA binding protein YcfA (HicA-like mRNA interferase family)